jgi:hypothetical protein
MMQRTTGSTPWTSVPAIASANRREAPGRIDNWRLRLTTFSGDSFIFGGEDDNIPARRLMDWPSLFEFTYNRFQN